MANSVVKVTDSMLNDSLLLLVGEDGTVTPDKESVKAYLNSKPDSTNIEVMHISKLDDQSIDVDIDKVTYLLGADGDYMDEASTSNLDVVAQNLINIKLDHDYTSYCGPSEDLDDISKTLSILEHGDTPSTVEAAEAKPLTKDKVTNLASHDNKQLSKNKISQGGKKTKLIHEDESVDEDFDEESEEDSDSDFDMEDAKITRSIKKRAIIAKIKPDKVRSPAKIPAKKKEETPTKVKVAPVVVTPPEAKAVEKKAPKKEKKPTKTIPDDFALFSTPDIIRRVSVKEQNVNVTEPLGVDLKPAKIENRSKSMTEYDSSPQKNDRLSLDGKVFEKFKGKTEKKAPIEGKSTKRASVDSNKRKSTESNKSRYSVDAMDNSLMERSATAVEDNTLASYEPSKTFSDSFCSELNSSAVGDQNSMVLDGSGLDLDPTLLENISNDLISEDILYQVAQSLVSNADLQNVIDKSINDGSMVLDAASIEQAMIQEQQNMQPTSSSIHHLTESPEIPKISSQKGTQIVRPDGRIVVIPPIERPTTRSRNKIKEVDRSLLKMTHKPLDEEHVSGNELDSSEEEEEESEDDPNKLWCICNQPHNNRFMICCDTCEEWYHGKCVNITKAMGQQMESEGKEWICLFCKDPMLKRPRAAARRIRKVSRNSRQSSDSTGSANHHHSGSVPCVVCHKASRVNSIFCSETCILAHAQGVERVVVFERATGNMITGSKAPSAANLEQWLKDHPGYEVVRSAGKVVTTKLSQNPPPTKSSGAIVAHGSPKGSGLSIQKQLPKGHPLKLASKTNVPQFKIVSKHLTGSQLVKTSTPIKSPVVAKARPVQVSSRTVLSPPVKDKPTPVKTPKARQSDQSSVQPKQENIRENVQKTLFEQLTNRLKLVDDLKLTEDEIKAISMEIESQLYKCFGDTGQKYRNKYRSLIFNIKDIKNQTLWRRICEKSINPYQLVRLSPDDLASQELALWREREAKHQLDMIKKSELELLNCNRQYVLKTHKGEQVLEDNRPIDHIENTEVLTSLTDEANAEKSSGSKERDKKNHSKSKDKDRKSAKEKGDSKEHHVHHRSTSRDEDRNRKRSRSRDRNSKHNDKRRSRSRGRDRHRKSSHKSSKHKKSAHRGSSSDKLDKKSKEILEQLVDNKIVPPLEDRLWKHVPQEDVVPAAAAESDSDHEPTSTVTIPTPPHTSEFEEDVPQPSSDVAKSSKNKEIENVADSDRTPASAASARTETIWSGVINMIDVAQISITAHEVSGDCNGLGSELPPNLDIVGRISPETVWDYIGKMKCSNSKIISLLRLNAINVEEKMPYLALYSYLSSRNRLGVVKSTNKAVKDFYILPLASQKPIPQALLPISGPGFEEARPALLLGIIVRDKRKRPLSESQSAMTKKVKVEITPATAVRSYTPPPVSDARLKLPLPPTIAEQDDDEPYSPEDSDPDSGTPIKSDDTKFLDTLVTTETFQPFSNKFNNIPGLDTPGLPSNTLEIQRQMEKLNKEIEMQKSEISNISQNIATASTEIGTSALASIALPSNLQQILDSIKTIGAAPSADVDEQEPVVANVEASTDLTIPLILPTSFTRSLNKTDTIPLNLPGKKKTSEVDKSGSVLSSLSEEDLIRKAEEEMLGQAEPETVSPVKHSKYESDQPPIPGLEMDEV